MPLTFIVVLTLITGMALEVASAGNNLTASLRVGDKRKAQEAAEFGMNALIDDLNNNENSYLLATRFQNPAKTGDWQSLSSTNLSDCSLLPPVTAPSANRIKGVATNGVNPTVAMPNEASVTYSMVGFEPAPSLTTPPSSCSMFGNLLGGQATITVRGTVVRGGVERARFDLVRTVNVEARNVLNPNQMGLVITGPPDESELGGPFFVLYDENDDGKVEWSGKGPVDPGANVNCVNCKSASDLDASKATIGGVEIGQPPGMPIFPAMPKELLGVKEVDLKKPKSTNYPYKTAIPDITKLEDECRPLTVNGVPNAEVGCRIGDVDIGGGSQLWVRADLRPVNFYVSGDFKLSGNGEMTVTDGSASPPPFSAVSKFWRNLRVYGLEGTPSANGKNCKQEITMTGGGLSYGGFFWFPLGKAKISGGGKKSEPDFYGSIWTCIFNKGGGNTSILVPKDAVNTLSTGTGGSYYYRAMGVN